MLVVILAASVACERFFNLVIENQATQDLTIYLDKEQIGNVASGKTITKSEIPGASIEYLVVAKNVQGEIIFSKTLTRSEMQYLGKDTFKIVIPPLKD